jgi:hypothetical protein
LVVQLFEEGLILSLLLLSLLKFKELVGQLFLQGSGLLHEHLLVLHIDNEGLVKLVEFLFSVLSTI